MTMPAPVTWVWERFRSSFRSLHSSASDTEPDDDGFLRPSQQALAAKSCLEDDVSTCAACKVTIHRHGPGSARPSAACPFCGQPYNRRLSVDPGPVVAGVGAGRVRSHRSTSDPLVSNFRLPPIENDDGLACRRLSSIMVSRLGTMDISELLLRPGSETQLPPIHKDKDPDILKVNPLHPSSRRSTPESGFRSALSTDTVISDLEEVRILPRYPTRHKTREDFLQDVRRAHHSENYIGIQRFYMRTFDSFGEICALFKVNKDEENARIEDPGLKMEFIYAVHDAVRSLVGVSPPKRKV